MEVITTPLVAEDFLTAKPDDNFMVKLRAEYECLENHGEEMCTESAFDCLVKVHGGD